MTAEPTPKVKSLYKALHLLDYFDQDHPDAGVTELAEYSGLLKSSVHNILQTFELCGYVTQSSETSRYMLGGAAVSLFSRFKATRKIDYRITEYLQSLRDMFHKNVYFAAKEQDAAVYLCAEQSFNHTGSPLSKEGAHAPLHATSLGKVLLGKQVSTRLLGAHQELAFRVGKMRKKFAAQYGFVVPEIKVTDDAGRTVRLARSKPSWATNRRRRRAHTTPMPPFGPRPRNSAPRWQ